MLIELSDELLAGLELFLADQAWKRDAACIEHPDVEFFIERGESSEPAKAVCCRCLVRADCLAYALDEGIKHGIWGGLSERERRRVRQAGRREAA